MNLSILLVDDEPLIRLTVGDALEAAGHEVKRLDDGQKALDLLTKARFDVVISDIRLPGADGLTIFRQLRAEHPDTNVILITAYGDVSDAVKALKDGAHDYLLKPFDTDEIVVRVARIAETRQMKRALNVAREQLRTREQDRLMIGRSPEMLKMFDRIDAFAGSDASVLIVGESGTGKELVAKALHRQSGRGSRPLVAVNCAAFPETLLEAELFGFERGAFTGATKRREGRFKAADGGTLFLDEIAEIPLPAQAKLLRVLQDKRVEPLGTNRSVSVNVRIVSATHRNLREWIATGRFREDLYYRLNVLELPVPPLRDRFGDLPLLIEHFVGKLSPEREHVEITSAAMRALLSYPFPGNVRELEHALHHAVVLSRHRPIELDHLPISVIEKFDASASISTPMSDHLHVAGDNTGEIVKLADAVRAFERGHLLRALRRTEGRRAQAAKLLGISRKTLWDKLKNHDVTDDEFGA